MKQFDILNMENFKEMYSSSDYAEFSNLLWNYAQISNSKLSQYVFNEMISDPTMLILTEEEISTLAREIMEISILKELFSNKYYAYCMAFLSTEIVLESQDKARNPFLSDKMLKEKILRVKFISNDSSVLMQIAYPQKQYHVIHKKKGKIYYQTEFGMEAFDLAKNCFDKIYSSK